MPGYVRRLIKKFVRSCLPWVGKTVATAAVGISLAAAPMAPASAPTSTLVEQFADVQQAPEVVVAQQKPDPAATEQQAAEVSSAHTVKSAVLVPARFVDKRVQRFTVSEAPAFGRRAGSPHAARAPPVA
jgi:hypothetical protein